MELAIKPWCFSVAAVPPVCSARAILEEVELFCFVTYARQHGLSRYQCLVLPEVRSCGVCRRPAVSARSASLVELVRRYQARG